MPMMSMSASGDKADIPRSAPSCSRTCLGHRPTENERAPAEAGALLQILPTANANTAAPPATTRTPAPAWAPSPIATAPCTAAGASAGPQTQRAVSTGEELCTRGGRLLTPIGAAASAFQAREPANRTATPAKAKSIFLDITSSLVDPRLTQPFY